MSDINIGAIVDDSVNTTLDTLRDQRDDLQQVTFTGVQSFNPQVFAAPGSSPGQSPQFHTMVLGPILFDTPFTSTPVVTFGQVGQVADQIQESIPVDFTPFIVVPYVYKWKFFNSGVDGFWLGLYAMTIPVATVTTHTVHWNALGSGSTYADQYTQDSWTEEYSHDDTDFLTVDSDTSDDGVSDGSTSDGGDF